MFVEMLTAKNEKISVNTDKVLFFAQAKKGTAVILDDGTVLDLQVDYESVRQWFCLCGVVQSTPHCSTD